MTFKKIILFTSVVAFGLSWNIAMPARITELPIPALEQTTLPSESFYLTSGLPLSKGRVSKVNELIVKDRSGQTVPTQFTPLAYWPDGSIKWVSISPVLGPYTEYPLALYSEEDAQSEVYLEVEQQGHQVRIDNGLVELVIDGGIWSLFEYESGESIHVQLELDRIVRTPQKVRSGWLAERRGVEEKGKRTYTSATEATVVEVEESGPVRAVVRVRGSFIAVADSTEFNRYDYRIYVYADSATVRWQPTWIFDGDPAVDSIGRIEAVISSDLSAIPAAQAVCGILTDSGGQTTVQFEDYIVQDEVNRINDSAGEQTGRLAGWISLTEPGQATINVAIKNFWQNYPSGFGIGNQNLEVGLWSGRSDYILDLARSSKGTGDGERGGDLDADATGVGKTFDLLINIGSSQEDFTCIAALFDLEPLFYPGSRYMTGTGVLGEIAHEDHDSFPRLEGYYKAATHWLLENQRHFNWYGFIDYGDVRTNFRHSTRNWHTDGRYGWRQGSGDLPHALMTQYFRTGDPVAWEVGAPYAKHVLDVDTVHYARQGNNQAVGAMHRRGQDHWSGLVQTHYTYTQGAFLYHYLSGDLRARSVLLEEIAPWQAEPDEAISVNAANTCVRAWEATLDQQWLDAARRQMDRHLSETAYNNFRFASDYVQALVQYTRLTDDPRGEETIRRRTEILMDPESWAYFYPGMGRRGGRLMLLAEMYHQTGDEVLYIKYPSRLLASILPRLAPAEETWDFDTLTDYAASVSLNATTHLSELARGPYYLGALQLAGWNEERLLSQPRIYGTPHIGANMEGTYSNVKQPMKKYGNAWEFLDLPAMENCAGSVQSVASSIRGLPAGGVLYVNNIPFKLALWESEKGGGALFLCEGSPVTLPVPRGSKALYLLGPMIERGDWQEGTDVVNYTLHLSNGQTRRGVWRNLLDLNDYRGFHYALTAVPGRFWQLGEKSRVHAYVMELDFIGESVEAVTLEASSSRYRSFILGATAMLSSNAHDNPIKTIVFTPTEAFSDSNVLVFDASTSTVDDGTKEGWLLSQSTAENLSFSTSGVTADGIIGLQIPLPNGDYLIDLDLVASTFRGGVLEIGVSGNGFGVVAISGMDGDRIQVPAQVRDGLLKVWANPIPALHASSHQRSRWSLRSVKVYPIPPGEWAFQPELPMAIIEGEVLGTHATFAQSVGEKQQYSFTGMEQLLASGSVYQVDPARYPQDIIFEFNDPVEITGLLFSAMEDHGPKGVILQVRRPDDDKWYFVDEWKLSPQSVGILDSVPRQEIVAARLLMNEGYSSRLILVRADVFGIRKDIR